ncbi:MAG: DUF1353 domain-containing protein [Filomicrobium sp.]
MDGRELAETVATDLGTDVVAAVQDAQTAADARSIGLGVGEAAAIGAFLTGCADLVVRIWRARQDRALLILQLAEADEVMQRVPQLDPEVRLDLTARVLARFLPDDFGLPGGHAEAKTGWINGYMASRSKQSANGHAESRSFAGGAPLLIPFADQDYWIVLNNIGWLPDGKETDKVVRVDVPKGFVTDLASVPGYLWPLLAKTGRHGNAAIFHDWLYCYQPCSRLEADNTFAYALKDMGVDNVTRRVMYHSVRIFGGRGWQRHGEEKQQGVKWILKEFPDDPRISWAEWRARQDVFA